MHQIFERLGWHHVHSFWRYGRWRFVDALRLFMSWANCSAADRAGGPLFSLHCALISLGFASATLIADGK